jgi:hypothetical protein
LRICAAIGHRALSSALLVLAGAAMSACGQSATETAHDDTPVINTIPRTTSRASSLVVIGYATKPNGKLVEQAVASLRDRAELASQRGPEIQRLHLKRIEQIGVTACDKSCPPSDDILGTATPDEGAAPGTVDCAVVLNMPLIQQSAREWELRAGEVTALVLVHEQEHCLRVPDDRETPAVAAELRLARKLHDARLVAYVKAAAKRLDASGYWKE